VAARGSGGLVSRRQWVMQEGLKVEHAEKLREVADSYQEDLAQVRQQLLQSEDAKDNLVVQFEQEKEEWQATQDFRTVAPAIPRPPMAFYD
jgi:hypothetical protein